MVDSSKEKRSRPRSLPDITRYAQCQEDAEKARHRLQKPIPTSQRMVLMDMQRTKINQIYERRHHLDVTGPRGLQWQCKKELERLETNERDLKRVKMALLPSISRYSLFSPDHPRRLSSITEENASLPPIETWQAVRGRASSTNSSQTSLHQLKPTQTRSSLTKINSIGQTSDNRSNFQQQTRLMHQQKQLLEQKIKDFLH